MTITAIRHAQPSPQAPRGGTGEPGQTLPVGLAASQDEAAE